MLTAAPKTLCREIFLSAPYSTIVPKKPALWGQKHGSWHSSLLLSSRSCELPGNRAESLSLPLLTHIMHGSSYQKLLWVTADLGDSGGSLAVGPLTASYRAANPTQQEAIRASRVRMTRRY